MSVQVQSGSQLACCILQHMESSVARWPFFVGNIGSSLPVYGPWAFNFLYLSAPGRAACSGVLPLKGHHNPKP